MLLLLTPHLFDAPVREESLRISGWNLPRKNYSLPHSENFIIVTSTVFEILAAYRLTSANFAYRNLETRVRGHSRSMTFGTNGKQMYTFLSVSNNIFVLSCTIFGDMDARRFLPTPSSFNAPALGNSKNFGMQLSLEKLERWGYCMMRVSWS